MLFSLLPLRHRCPRVAEPLAEAQGSAQALGEGAYNLSANNANKTIGK